MPRRGQYKEICKRGHIRTEHGSGVSCKPCFKITQKEWEIRRRGERGEYFKWWHIKNRERRLAASRISYQENKEKILEKHKMERNSENSKIRARTWRNYGITNKDGSKFTTMDYNRTFQIQGGTCKGCGVHQSELKRRLYADHDHATGFFRGLLCYKCNSILGWCNDKRETLQNLIAYLDFSRG